MADSTVYPYLVTLKNETSRYVNLTGLLLSVGSALLFLRELLLTGTVIFPYLLGIIFIAGLLAWNYRVWRKRTQEIYFSKALLIAGLVWTKMPYFQWLVAVFALLAILEYQAKYSPAIGFSSDKVVFYGLLRKKYAWSELDNVILKDGLLTIDFKNNRLLQKEIESGENEASEEEFNQWCRLRLERK